MIDFFTLAAVITLLTAVVHSILGEIRIFQPLRRRAGTSVDALPARHFGILWATWHARSVLGVGYCVILINLATGNPGDGQTTILEMAIVGSMLGASALVLIGTRARHPGWIALLLVAVFTYLG